MICRISDKSRRTVCGRVQTHLPLTQLGRVDRSVAYHLLRLAKRLHLVVDLFDENHFDSEESNGWERFAKPKTNAGHLGWSEPVPDLMAQQPHSGFGWFFGSSLIFRQ